MVRHALTDHYDACALCTDLRPFLHKGLTSDRIGGRASPDAPRNLRARFHLAEAMEKRDIVALLRAIARRGTQGIVLKAPATPGIEACLADLAAQKIPIVT